MKDHGSVRRDLVEYIQGELAADRTPEIEQHLADCPRCREECTLLRKVLRLMPAPSEPPSDRQDGEYWNAFARRVDARLAGQQRRPARFGVVFDILREYLWPRWRPILVSAAAGAALATVILLWLRTGSERPPVVPGVRDVSVMQTAHREELNDYFERSRILLIGIANIPAEEGDKVDLSVERNAARDLVHTARYLEQKPIDSRSRELIRELERVLIELANLEERADVPDVDVIRAGMQQQNLLFRIRMAENPKR
jgi:hypothetical protein